MNCTYGILQPMNCTSGKKVVFIAAWKALFPWAVMKSSSENDMQHRESECLKNDRLWDTQTMAPHQAHSHKLDASHTLGIT